MFPESFEYHAPKTLEEALRFAAEFGDSGKLLAGGHSLLPMMKLRLASPRHLIDIGRIGELHYIRDEGDWIAVGALSTHHEIEASRLLRDKCPLLPETAGEIGDAQVRNRGTIGGSVAHADPAADWPAALVALDAEIKTAGPQGERTIAAADFFVDLMATALAAGEIVTGIGVPVRTARCGETYAKFRHPASGFAVVGVAVRLALAENGTIGRTAVGVTGVGAKAYRASEVEKILAGKSPSANRLAEASSRAAAGVEANSDLYASADYRKHLAGVLTRRALERAVERARQ
jgi:aerobic carbon-monoxide dehydrogenase medium subunit